MEFEEHEDQEEGIGPNFEAPDSGRPKLGLPGDAAGKSGGGRAYRYRECQKNHAVGIGGHAVDGCGEFIAAGDDGTLDALKCAACDCHRNFHRKEAEGEVRRLPPPHLLSYHHSGAAGYLHVTPPPLQQRRPLALPSTVRRDDDNFSNPSSSGGGGIGSSKKRHRTKFTAEQKEMMLSLAERLGWRLQKQDEAAVEQFCNETGLKRHVLKVWMHNNKHTLGKKP